MSTTVKLILGAGLLAMVAACGPREEPVVVAPEPISSEPAFTGKYK